MSWFSNIAKTVIQKGQQLLQKAVQQHSHHNVNTGPQQQASSSSYSPPPPSAPSAPSSSYGGGGMDTSGISFSISSNLGGAFAAVEVGAEIYFDQEVSAALLRAVGEAGVDRMRQQLEPFRRTGGLERSWTYYIDYQNQSVRIFSDHPAASSIQYGYLDTNIDNLKDWMKHKQEFQGLTEKEKNVAAFNIYRKIKKRHQTGGNSEFRTLNPSGQRQYDFLTPANRLLQADINDLLDSMARARY